MWSQRRTFSLNHYRSFIFAEILVSFSTFLYNPGWESRDEKDIFFVCKAHANISSCFPSVVSSAGFACAGVSGSVFSCIPQRSATSSSPSSACSICSDTTMCPKYLNSHIALQDSCMIGAWPCIGGVQRQDGYIINRPISPASFYRLKLNEKPSTLESLRFLIRSRIVLNRTAFWWEPGIPYQCTVVGSRIFALWRA